MRLLDYMVILFNLGRKCKCIFKKGSISVSKAPSRTQGKLTTLKLLHCTQGKTHVLTLSVSFTYTSHILGIICSPFTRASTCMYTHRHSHMGIHTWAHAFVYTHRHFRARYIEARWAVELWAGYRKPLAQSPAHRRRSISVCGFQQGLLSLGPAPAQRPRQWCGGTLQPIGSLGSQGSHPPAHLSQSDPPQGASHLSLPLPTLLGLPRAFVETLCNLGLTAPLQAQTSPPPHQRSSVS